MSEKIIARGAEAILVGKNSRIIKKRISKGYRIKGLDEKLRKLRTRHEASIMERLHDKINVPKIIKIDEKRKKVEMEFIHGKKLSDNLDKFSLKKQKEICKEIGEEVSKLHESNIIHSDLTTSNMILKNNKVFLIDFGLSFHSLRNEDRAVDLHLFKQALESRHFKNWQELWKSFLLGYKDNKEYEKTMKQLERVELRGRYKH